MNTFRTNFTAVFSYFCDRLSERILSNGQSRPQTPSLPKYKQGSLGTKLSNGLLLFFYYDYEKRMHDQLSDKC